MKIFKNKKGVGPLALLIPILPALIIVGLIALFVLPFIGGIWYLLLSTSKGIPPIAIGVIIFIIILMIMKRRN